MTYSLWSHATTSQIPRLTRIPPILINVLGSVTFSATYVRLAGSFGVRSWVYGQGLERSSQGTVIYSSNFPIHLFFYSGNDDDTHDATEDFGGGGGGGRGIGGRRGRKE